MRIYLSLKIGYILGEVGYIGEMSKRRKIYKARFWIRCKNSWTEFLAEVVLTNHFCFCPSLLCERGMEIVPESYFFCGLNVLSQEHNLVCTKG